ncbi:MAG: efflux RND transporter periplasmic adaptor subunit [Pirellulales bacterium]|nr:efflux RND transporter periplasmic adaptor subunit [Pirellulales bacterium]
MGRFFAIGWLAALWVCILAVGPSEAQEAASEPRPQPVKAAEIIQARIEMERAFVGTVIPTRVSQVSSTVESRVVTMFVEAGDRVKKDDKLAQLRTETVQLDLQMANAELALLKYELERLKVALPKELEQAKARMKAAEALKNYTKARLERNESLSTDKVISKDEKDEILSAATGALKVFEERTIGWELAAATNPINIKEAEAKLKVQQEKIARLEDDLSEHTILAPFDGYVTREYSEVGQWLAKGAPLVEVIEINKDNEIEIQIPVLESYISHLKVRSSKDKPGTKTTRVVIEALPGEKFEGEVAAIVPMADINARTFPVKVRLTNRQGPNGILLKPGMLASVTLPVTEVLDAVLVPKDALILEEGKDTSVWVIRKGRDFDKTHVGQAVPVAVSLGEAEGDWIQVSPLKENMRELLQPGGMVVTEGNERINPTLPARVIETVKHGKP